MAWRRPGDKPLSEPVMVCSPTHICVTRPQWVKQTGGTNKFWDTVKPSLTNKVKSSDDVISLKVNDSIVNDHLVVCNMFNEYFSDVASGFDNDRSIDDDESIDCIVKSHEGHTSLQLTQENVTLTDDWFSFSELTSNEVKSLKDHIDHKKYMVVTIFHQNWSKKLLMNSLCPLHPSSMNL